MGSAPKEAEKKTELYASLSRARCPLCSDEIFLPKKSIRDNLGGDNSKSNPVVMCTDMGHWCGYLSDCKSINRTHR